MSASVTGRVILLVSIMVAVGAYSASAKQTERPNVVFFLVDDLGWKDLSCYGSTFYETPNLDELVNGGMRFTNAYASCPVCSPTRAAIMTGKYQQRVGIINYGKKPLPPGEVTMAAALKEAGYKTFFAGKWHLSSASGPLERGFDVNKGGCAWGQPKSYYCPYGNPVLSDGPEGEYLTDRLANEAVQFIEANKKSPFFVCLSFYTVHTPKHACKKHIARFTKKASELPEADITPIKESGGVTKARQDDPQQASMIHAMDENVGRVLNKLTESGLAENTIVVFTADNGGRATLVKRPGETCNLPLRAGKGWCYEGGIRVCSIVKAPGVTKPGSVCDTPIISMDYYPTLLELTGCKLKPEQHKDGLSLVRLLKGEKALAREALYWDYPMRHGSGWGGGSAVRSGDWKLVQLKRGDKVELYNLKTDLGEHNDLSAKYPHKIEALQSMFREWKKDVADN